MWCTGEKLAKKLDRRLAQHRAEEGDPPAVYTTSGVDCISIGIGENSGSVKRSKVTSPKAGESSRDLGDIQPTNGKVSDKKTQILCIYKIFGCLHRGRELRLSMCLSTGRDHMV